MNIFGFDLSNVDLWLLGVASVCLAWLIPHRLTIWRERHARRAAACIAFRAAILAKLGAIYPDSYKWPDDIRSFLRDAFPALQIAVSDFREFVPWWRRKAFDLAWQRYYGNTPDQNEPHLYYQYMAFDDNQDYKTIFHDNVKSLLSFAKET